MIRNAEIGMKVWQVWLRWDELKNAQILSGVICKLRDNGVFTVEWKQVGTSNHAIGDEDEDELFLTEQEAIESFIDMIDREMRPYEELKNQLYQRIEGINGTNTTQAN